MKIRTQWWGCELLAESEDEWQTMTDLFEGAEVTRFYEDGELNIDPIGRSKIDPGLPGRHGLIEIVR